MIRPVHRFTHTSFPLLCVFFLFLLFFLSTFFYVTATSDFFFSTKQTKKLSFQPIFCGWLGGRVSSWQWGLRRPAALSLSGGPAALLSVSPLSCARWQQRQAGKMGARRDDMWQRLRARLAGTQRARESPALLERRRTLLFMPLGSAPRDNEKIITTTVSRESTFRQLWQVTFVCLGNLEIKLPAGIFLGAQIDLGSAFWFQAA